MKARGKKALGEVNVMRKKYPPFSKVEERELFARIKLGDEVAREKIILHNTGFIARLARKYEDRGLPIDDLIQEGYIGLMVAIDKFDVTRRIKFISFAVWWARQYMLTAIRLSRVVPDPDKVAYLKGRIRKFCDAYYAEFHQNPPLDSIAHMFKIDKNSIYQYLSGGILSLDQVSQFQDGNSQPLHEKIPDESVQIDERLVVSEEVEIVVRTLDELVSARVLKPRHRDIFFTRHGFSNVGSAPVLLGLDIPSLEEVGKVYGITRERARQICDKVMMKLRSALTHKMKGL